MTYTSGTSHQQERHIETNLMPSTFDPAYVEGALKPFWASTTYQGEHPVLPMIDLAFSKGLADSPHLFGLFYTGWKPEPEMEGVSVFLQAYDQRGPHNERKRIYYSAQTPDLYVPRRPDLSSGNQPGSTSLEQSQ